MEFNAYSLLVDFMWAAIFLFGAKILREKIKVLQSLFVPDLNPAFGMLIPAGFQGGHGTAAALGQTLLNLGWADATDLAMTAATVGILTGIFGGIALIKIGTKKNRTQYVKDFSKLPDDMRTGLIEKGKRPILGEETVSPMALDPLAWHLLLILIPTGIGYLLTNAIQDATGLGVPSFSVGFLVAILFHFLLKGISADKYVDSRIISRMGSCATDFLVFFGVASIKIPVVIKYAVPFGLLMIFGIVWVVFHFTVIAPRLLKQEWFERGIYVYGYSTGVTAIGMALLRIVDPENKSCTLDDAAIVTPIESMIEIFALAVVPVACVQGNWVAAVIPILMYLAVLLIVPVVFKWWHKHPYGVYDESQEA